MATPFHRKSGETILLESRELVAQAPGLLVELLRVEQGYVIGLTLREDPEVLIVLNRDSIIAVESALRVLRDRGFEATDSLPTSSGGTA